MPKGIVHTEENVQLGLRVLALCGGNARVASELLASEGVDIHRTTLSQWRREKYAHRYYEILHEQQTDIEARNADRAAEIVGKATDAENLLIDETVAKLGEIPAKDLARSALAMTQVKAENARTSRLLRDRPTSIREVREPDELIEELRALGIAHRNRAIDVEVLDDEPVAS